MTGLDPRLVARLLRQRSEMGLPALVLERTPREALLEAVRRAAAEMPRGAPEVAATPAGRPESTPPEPRRSTPASVTPVAAKTEASSSADVIAQSPQEAPKVDGLDYEALKELALGCTRCGLSETRTQVVFSDGHPDARLVVVGEAPGANEDRTGLPFVGQAGKLLDLMLASVDLSREASVYICNVLKCRPPGNRNPQADEIRSCSPFLLRQLELVAPQALLAVGTFAAQLLTSTDAPLGKLRGTVHSYQGIPLVVTYHPAALLRNSGWVRAAWDDLQLLRQVMD
ncbi:MAG: uracil-DNA glycosylase [Gemmatimonadota bacterium]